MSRRAIARLHSAFHASSETSLPSVLSHAASFSTRTRVAVAASADFAVLEKLAAVQIGMCEAQFDELAGEFTNALTAPVEIPIEPGKFVVLAVAVVVAHLRARFFIAAGEHGHALREHQRSEKVAHLALPHLVDRRILGGTLGAHIPS